jgi:hypothetical protein
MLATTRTRTSLLARPDYDAPALIVDGGVTLDLGARLTGGPSRDAKTGRVTEWVRVFVPPGTRVFKSVVRQVNTPVARPNSPRGGQRLDQVLVPAQAPNSGIEFWTARQNLVFLGDSSLTPTPPPPPPPVAMPEPAPEPPRLGVAAAIFLAVGGLGIAYAMTRACVSSHEHSW